MQDPMSKRVQNRLAMAHRVAERFLKAAPAMTFEKMQALLLKLRKGTGDLSVKQIIAALEHLGGWKIEEVVGLLEDPHYHKGHIFLDRNEAFVRQKWTEAKRDEVSALPTHPQLRQVYYTDVSEVAQPHGWGPDVWAFDAHVYRGVPTLRFTSPEGDVFDFMQKPMEDLYKMRTWDLRKWLQGKTKLVEQVSRALAMPTPNQEKAERAPRTRENTGSCPCCFGNYKLKATNQLPKMVLHGFLRPGWGSIQGRCYGVDFPPFELSPEGTQHLHKTLLSRLDNLRDHYAKLKNDEIKSFLEVGGTKTKPTVKTITPETEGARWPARIEREIKNTAQSIESVKQDAHRLERLITNWKPQPLPEPGKSMSVW